MRQLRVDQAEIRQRYHAVLIHIADKESDPHRAAALGTAVGRRDVATPVAKPALLIVATDGVPDAHVT